MAPRAELNSNAQVDFDEQVKTMSSEQIFDQLGQDNAKLARLGVRVPISMMVYGAIRFGYLYEYRLINESGSLRPTPMNCLMALLHNQPDLKQLPQGDFEELGKVVSRVAVVTEALLEKTGGFDWPHQFTHRPQRLLNPGPAA